MIKKVIGCILLCGFLFGIAVYPVIAGKSTSYILGSVKKISIVDPEDDQYISTDITFWWRTDGGVGMQTDYSAGSTFPNIVNGAILDTSRFKIGGSSLKTTGAGSYVEFFQQNNITPGNNGRIGFYFYISVESTNTNTGLVHISNLDSGDNIRLYMNPVNEISVTWENVSSGITRTTQSSGANLFNGSWYYAELSWRSDLREVNIWIDGVSVISSTLTNVTSFDAQSLKIGNWSTSTATLNIDNVIVSNNSITNLNTIRNYTTYPGYSSFPYITFKWGCNNWNLIPGDFTMGDHITPFVIGDSSFLEDGKIGSTSVSTIDGSVAFDAEDLIHDTGRLGTWFKVEELVDSELGIVLYLSNYATGEDYRGFNLEVSYDSPDSIFWIWKDPTEKIIECENTGIINNDWVFIELSWNAEENTRNFYLNGDLCASSTDSISPMEDLGSFYNLFLLTPTPHSFMIDQVMISSSETRNFYLLADKYNFPVYGVPEYYDLKFFWRAENSLLEPNYDIAGYSNSPTFSGNAIISGEESMVGPHSLKLGNGPAYVEFEEALDITANSRIGSLGFWVYQTTEANGYYSFAILEDDNSPTETIQIGYNGTTNKIEVTYFNDSDSFDYTMPEEEWAFIELTWNLLRSPLHTVPTIMVFINGSIVHHFEGASLSYPDFITKIIFGTKDSVNGEYFLDNMLISADSGRDLHSIKTYNRRPDWVTTNNWEDIHLWWRMDSDNLDGWNDFSSGDHTVDYVGGAGILSGASKIGTAGLYSSGTCSYAGIDIDGFDIFNPFRGIIGMWVKGLTTLTDGTTVWNIFEDSDNFINMTFDEGEFEKNWTKDGTEYTVQTSGANSEPDEWYYVEFIYDRDVPKRLIRVNNMTLLRDFTEFGDLFDPSVFVFGNSCGAVGGNTYIDNVCVSDFPDRNCYELRNETSYPGLDSNILDNISVWYRMENEVPDPINDYFIHTTPNIQNYGAEFLSWAKKTGGHGLSIKDNKFYQFTFGAHHFNKESGAMGFWLFPISGGDNNIIFTSRLVTDSGLDYQLSLNGGELSFLCGRTNIQVATGCTIEFGNNWYFIELNWNIYEGYATIKVNGELCAEVTSAWQLPNFVDPSIFRFGSSTNPIDFNVFIDQLIISTNSNDNLYQLRGTYNYP